MANSERLPTGNNGLESVIEFIGRDGIKAFSLTTEVDTSSLFLHRVLFGLFQGLEGTALELVSMDGIDLVKLNLGVRIADLQLEDPSNDNQPGRVPELGGIIAVLELGKDLERGDYATLYAPQDSRQVVLEDIQGHSSDF